MRARIVSWPEAVDYCEWAGVELPTESEWLSAADRGYSCFHFGYDERKLAKYGWYDEHPLRQKGLGGVGGLFPNRYVSTQ